MMLRLDDNGTLKKLEAKMQRMESGNRIAMAIALTKTVDAAKKDEQAEMRDVFDRPRPYTLNGVFTRPATRGKLQAEVGLKNLNADGRGAGKYLRAQVFGGARRLKAFEVALRGAGILPNGMYVVPGEGARMDAYGNISRGQINQILSYLRVQAGTAGYNRPSSDKSAAGIERRLAQAVAAQNVQYFVGAPADGKLPLGIWQRVRFSRGTAIKPVMIFVNWQSYEQNYDFHHVARLAVRKNFARLYAQELRRSARRSK